MGYSNNLVTAPVSTGDIAQALGVSSNDVGTLCSSASIKPFAKYKPQSHDAIFGGGDKGQLTDAQRIENSWGIFIVNRSTGQAITQFTMANLANAVWRYGARTKYRMLDFIKEGSGDNYAGYNSGAPTHVLCPTSMDALSVNEVNDNHALYEAIAFFIFQAGGHTRYNVDINGQLVPNLSYCLDLNTLFGGNLYGESGSSARLGLALKNNSTNTWSFLPCTADFVFLEAGATYDNNMDHLDIKYATQHIYPALSAGSYTAYPSVRVGDGSVIPYEYYPMHSLNGLNQICSIPLTIGGTDLYQISYEGISLSPSGVPSTAQQTISGSDIYLFLRVKNNTGVQHNTSRTASLWTMKGVCNGTYINPQTETGKDIVNIEHDGTDRAPASFTINAGGYTIISFKLSRIFNLNPRVADNAGSGSSVRITAHLYYNGTEFTVTGSMVTNIITKA